MIVVMLCRHVRRYLRVCDVALQNALQWLHQGSSLRLPASRDSCWSGCIEIARVICQQIFSILALIMFL